MGSLGFLNLPVCQSFCLKNPSRLFCHNLFKEFIMTMTCCTVSAVLCSHVDISGSTAVFILLWLPSLSVADPWAQILLSLITLCQVLQSYCCVSFLPSFPLRFQSFFLPVSCLSSGWLHPPVQLGQRSSSLQSCFTVTVSYFSAAPSSNRPLAKSNLV